MIDIVEFEELNEKDGIGELRIVGDISDIEKIEEFALNMLDCEPEEEVDMVNHPNHYTNSGIECIHEMILLFGIAETKSFCKLNAHKYRKRAMDKGGRQDMKKSDWYINMYAYLDNTNEYNIKQEIVKLYKDYIKL